MIVFCGYANRDITVEMDVLPIAGERRHARLIRQFDGGMAANAAVAAARFDAEPMFAGALGSDAQSLAFVAALEREGIATAWTRTDARLTHAVVLLDSEGERSVISEDDALTTQDLRRVLEQLRHGDHHWVYVDGYRWRDRWVPETEVSLVVDVDGCTSAEEVVYAAQAARHLVGSNRTLKDLCGFSGEGLAQLAAAASTTIIATSGAQGLTAFEPGMPAQHVPATRITAVDDTGAGDCFAGVYVAELARGQPVIAAATTAAAAATLSCLQPGARTSPTRAELSLFLTQHQINIFGYGRDERTTDA